MDLRVFLSKLMENGQLANISQEVDWDIQAGSISTMNNRNSGPAIHFKKIKDYPSEYSLASSLFTGPSNLEDRPEKPWSRQAICQGLNKNIGYEEYIKELINRTAQAIPPLLVKGGACQENVISGQDVDILHFPFPYIHGGDGGRYGNCSIIISRDPQTGWQYCGWHRWMIVDNDVLALNFSPPIAPWLAPDSYHLGTIYHKYKEMRKPMPCAIAIGGSPSFFIASAMFNPANADIPAIGGGLVKEPISLVKTEGTELFIPSEAEIIIEGEISPWETVEEGPYPDIIRRTSKIRTPAFKIKKITYRKEPVLPFMADGDKGGDYISLVSSLVSLNLTQFVGKRGVEIRWLNCPVEAMMSLCVISIERLYAGHPAQAARTCFTSPLNRWFDKILVLDPDVEPVDWPVILNSLIEKANPEKNFHYVRGVPSYLVSYSNSDEKNGLIAKKLYIDATYPLWWEPSWLAERLSIETCFPEDILRKVTNSWKDYGIPGEPCLKKTRRLRIKKEG